MTKGPSKGTDPFHSAGRGLDAVPILRVTLLCLSLGACTQPQESAPPSTPGFSGPTPSIDRSQADEEGFLPLPDRWRAPFPEYDRFGTRDNGLHHGNYMLDPGDWFDPYRQNLLKGDYPIGRGLTEDLFFSLSAISDTVVESRRLARLERDGTPNTHEQLAVFENVTTSFELFDGTGPSKPRHWSVRVSPVFNATWARAEDRGILEADPSEGKTRTSSDVRLQEAYFQVQLADVSAAYDSLAMRIGRQPFQSDFRGFVFSDWTQGVRLFGSAGENRHQWNLAYFYPAEKATNSQLNTFDVRHQHVLVMNWAIQDSLALVGAESKAAEGLTTQFSFHANIDDQSGRSPRFSENGFRVRPEPWPEATPRDIQAYYLGVTTDGHVGSLNLGTAFYWAWGRDDANYLANTSSPGDGSVRINAQMAAVEASVDRDWMRFRASFLWASGDSNPGDSEANGFDGIMESPSFAGTSTSYWGRQALGLRGLNLVSRGSFYPDLSASKLEGQSNFVNPGLWLLNAGWDADLTPKLNLISNANGMWLHHPEPLEEFVDDENVSRAFGVDLSVGLIYRPLLNDNVAFSLGAALFLPMRGFRQVFDESDPLSALFGSATFAY